MYTKSIFFLLSLFLLPNILLVMNKPKDLFTDQKLHINLMSLSNIKNALPAIQAAIEYCRDNAERLRQDRKTLVSQLKEIKTNNPDGHTTNEVFQELDQNREKLEKEINSISYHRRNLEIIHLKLTQLAQNFDESTPPAALELICIKLKPSLDTGVSKENCEEITGRIALLLQQKKQYQSFNDKKVVARR